MAATVANLFFKGASSGTIILILCSLPSKLSMQPVKSETI